MTDGFEFEVAPFEFEEGFEVDETWLHEKRRAPRAPGRAKPGMRTPPRKPGPPRPPHRPPHPGRPFRPILPVFPIGPILPLPVLPAPGTEPSSTAGGGASGGGEPGSTAGDEPVSGQPEPAPDSVETCESAVILDGFEKGGYAIKSHHYEPLDRFLLSLSGLGAQFGSTVIVRIVGHTDNTGSTKTNEGLSFNRAFEVERFINAMVGDVRAEVSAAGSSRPIASNSTEAGRRRNRRVELRLCRVTSGTTTTPAATRLKREIEELFL